MNYCDSVIVKAIKKKNLKIGVVDDHVQSAVEVSNMLEYCGVKTFQAYNVEDAVKLCKKENLNILIFDINLLSNIKEELNLCDVKIVSVGFENNGVREIKKKVIGFVKKPVDVKELFEVLKKTLTN